MKPRQFDRRCGERRSGMRDVWDQGCGDVVNISIKKRRLSKMVSSLFSGFMLYPEEIREREILRRLKDFKG